jgi:hypothetical protein
MNSFCNERVWAVFALLTVPVIADAQALPHVEPPKATLVLEDQFERKQDIAQFRGDVLVLLYGDRSGSSANRALGETLHVRYHPSAKGKSPAEAAKAPATPVPDLKEGMRSPDVRVVPVACIDKAPDVMKPFIRGRFKKDAPDTVVLLDFDNKMKEQFGMREGEPNLVVIDALGRVRMKVGGELDQITYTRLLQAVDYLRREGAR